jgi:hypothetical protein
MPDKTSDALSQSEATKNRQVSDGNAPAGVYIVTIARERFARARARRVVSSFLLCSQLILTTTQLAGWRHHVEA